MSLPQASLFLPGPDGARLHLRHFGAAGGPRVMMLHGAVESGRVFWSPSGRGLGPFLAGAGCEVFAADFRGHGLSTPRIARGHAYGQTETITEEIPLFARFLAEQGGGRPAHWVAHSWGGVLLLAALGRYPALRPQVASVTCFGSKRCVRVQNLERWLLIDLYWLRAARLLARIFGYLPSARLGLGSDDETARAHEQGQGWVRPGPWIDPADGFDYAAALAAAPDLPPAWFLAGAADACLGHPADVRDLMAEAGLAQARFTLLGRAAGHRRDYDHLGLLVHPDAADDHFPAVRDWIGAHEPCAGVP